MSRNAVAAFAVLVAAGFAGCAATARAQTPPHGASSVQAHVQTAAPFGCKP
ncbi:MAG: hypothetical protein NW203_15165 [Hyphomonadaceae bacterium]|nr:hypothetical protein [Hyphomonadaceae bacterium]